MSFFSKYKSKVKLSVLLAVCLAAACFSGIFAQADNVEIHSCADPLLKEEKIGDGVPWQATTSFNQDNFSSDGKRQYKVTTDSYVIWYEHDDFDYYYTPYYFAYGKKASMTIETTLNSWDMPYATASAGICVRSSLDKSAATAFLHVRENGGVTLIYRPNDNAAEYSVPVYTNVTTVFPIRLKMVIQNNKVKCYYALNGKNTYSEIAGSYTFNYGENIMVGLGTHCSIQKQATAVYEGLNISISAPEGTEYKEYGSSNGGEESSDVSSVITLPEDLPITDDVLFMETFTDGSMTSGEESRTNPIWSTDNKTPNDNIQLDETDLNRYLLLDSDGHWYFAGDQKMSDYSLNMDVNFSKESMTNEVNNFRVYVRHRYSAMTGHYYYYIDFKWDGENKKGTVTLCKGYHNSNPVNGTYPQSGRELSNASGEKAVYSFDYLDPAQLGVNHDLQIDVIDNKITVYWDGGEIAYGEDNDTSKFFNGFGNIGFYSNLATVAVDNICVRPIVDYLGGDYDNKIGGSFDEKIPDYIDTYSKKSWVY